MSTVGAIEHLRVPADGLELHVTRSGASDGEQIVWLHGSGPGATGMSNFGQNMPAFADFDNLVFDLPRYGESDRPSIEGPLAQFSARQVTAALDSLGISATTFIGNSFGGGVAALIAASRPSLVRRLVLMAPGGVRPPELKVPDDLPIGLKLIFDYMTNGPDRERMRRLVETMLHDPGLVTEDLVEGRFAASQKGAEIDMTSGLLNLGDASTALTEISCPVMLIWGREDNFVPAAWAWRWLEAVGDAELHVLPHCGHWVQFERRADFDRLAGEFVRR
jgi:4,5:9,10-diseco-3-hydroxy-5,9,17-trioxoandrosta-1(10),2-diene-4-oate hydrolase